MKKIGIIGGTFDPIHFGHLILAEQARDGAKLDQVIFIPARMSPYKTDKKITDDMHRYEMVKKAICGNSGFVSSDMELKGPEISYTIKTLEKCKEKYGKEAEIYFICGTDAFLGIEGWLDSDLILKNFPLIVGSRPRYKDKARDELIERFCNAFGSRIMKVHMPKIDISSTGIKKRIKEGRSIKYLLPPEVEEYIHENCLYR